MTKMKTTKSIDAIVDVMMKAFKKLEAIIENLNDKVTALETNETQLKEYIDILISKLENNTTDKEQDKLETELDRNIESHETIENVKFACKIFEYCCTKYFQLKKHKT